MNHLEKALVNDGFLFLGISETAAANHPLLAERYFADAFFFQKTSNISHSVDSVSESMLNGKERRSASDRRTNERRIEVRRAMDINAREEKHPAKYSRTVTHKSPVDCREVKTILETDEGKPDAKNIIEILANSGGGLAASLSGSELAACAVYFLNVQDFISAELVLSYLEKCCNGPFALFLRGEYHLLQGNNSEAELYFEKAAGKEKAFWPAFYRTVTLAAGGNPDRLEYKIKKAFESLELGREFHYECFMGGFSPGYFQRILEQKIS